MSRTWRFLLVVIRVGLGAVALMVITTTFMADSIELGIDDRVRLETTYAEGGPGSGGEPKWGADRTPLHLWVDTPRFASLCPDRFVKLRENEQGYVGVTRPADCAAARAIREKYGANPAGVTVHKVVLHPPASVRRNISAAVTLSWLVLLIAGVCVERLLTAAASGDPFASSTVRWVRGLALAIGGLLLAVPNAANLVVADLVRTYVPAIDPPGVEVSPWSVLAVIVAFALAEVWRYGARLQREVNATV